MLHARHKPWAFIPYLIGFIFFASAIYKGLLPDQAHSAVTKVGASHAVATWLVWATIFAEMYLAGGLVFSASQSRFAKLSVHLLVIFSVFLGALLLKGGRSCGCTGVESFFGTYVNPLYVGLFRNAVLIVLTECYLWRTEPRVTAG